MSRETLLSLDGWVDELKSPINSSNTIPKQMDQYLSMLSSIGEQFRSQLHSVAAQWSEDTGSLMQLRFRFRGPHSEEDEPFRVQVTLDDHGRFSLRHASWTPAETLHFPDLQTSTQNVSMGRNWALLVSRLLTLLR